MKKQLLLMWLFSPRHHRDLYYRRSPASSSNSQGETSRGRDARRARNSRPPSGPRAESRSFLYVGDERGSCLIHLKYEEMIEKCPEWTCLTRKSTVPRKACKSQTSRVLPKFLLDVPNGYRRCFPKDDKNPRSFESLLKAASVRKRRNDDFPEINIRGVRLLRNFRSIKYTSNEDFSSILGIFGGH